MSGVSLFPSGGLRSFRNCELNSTCHHHSSYRHCETDELLCNLVTESFNLLFKQIILN